jgi:zona occludens toxin
MAIDAYTGLPGAGKSYGVMEHVIMPSLEEGRHILTNIPLELDLLREKYPDCVVEQMQVGWENDPDWADTVPNGCVLVVDEVWRRWKSGQKVSNCNPKDLELLKEHRHRVDEKGNSMRVVLVTQNAGDLASWVRDLVATLYVMEKLDHAGLSKRFKVDIYRGCPTGKKIPENLKTRTTYGTYKKEIYQYYKSATQSKTGDVGDESKADKRGSMWRSPVLWFYLVGGPILIGIALWYLNGLVNKYEKPKKPDAVQVNPMPEDLKPKPAMTTIAAAGVPISSVQAAPAQSNPMPSSNWRVVGFLKRGTNYQNRGTDARVGEFMQDTVILAHALGGLRYLPATECTQYSDKINYWCDVDGERATPWSGRSGVTTALPRTATTAAAASSVPSGATNAGSLQPVSAPSQPAHSATSQPKSGV